MIVIAEGCLAIIIRITSVGSLVMNWNEEKSVGSSLGPRWVLPGIFSPHFLYYYQQAKTSTEQIHAARRQGPPHAHAAWRQGLPHTHTSDVGIATYQYSLEYLLEIYLSFSS